jgi:hypothetical protein
MTTSDMARAARAPAEFAQQKDPIITSGDRDPVQGPMSQQDAADCHGHDMHPQKFVRLVGCHESNPVRDQVA